MNDDINRNTNGDGAFADTESVNNEKVNSEKEVAANENVAANPTEVKNEGDKGDAASNSLEENKPEENKLDWNKPETSGAAVPPPVGVSSESNSKKSAAIIITACVIGVIVTVIGIIGIVRLVSTNPGKDDITPESSTEGSFNAYVPESVSSTGETELTSGEDETSDAIVYIPSTTKKAATTAKNNSGNADTTAVQQTIEGLPPLEKTGDNILSDSADNEFIKLVSEKYGVDPKNLVAIYAIPDKGNNFVLEFDGTTDANGNIVKSPDTLKRVHQVDKERNIVTATGSVSGNVGVSYAEGKFVFYIVTNLIMPQYPDYFTGVQPLD